MEEKDSIFHVKENKKSNRASTSFTIPRAIPSRYASTKASSGSVSSTGDHRASITRKTTDYMAALQKIPKNQSAVSGNNPAVNVKPLATGRIDHHHREGGLERSASSRGGGSGNVPAVVGVEKDELSGKRNTLIRIKTCHKTYVCALNDKNIVEHSVDKLEDEYIWTRFELADNTISLKCYYNRFLSAEKGGKVSTNRSKKQYETFFVETIPNAEKKFALKTSFGEYLSALPDGSLQSNRFGPQPWETFEIEEEPFAPPVYGGNLNDIIVYQLKNGLYSKVPYVLEFLADYITKLDGHQTEGIWRISGDGVAVIKIRSEIQKGNYDCHIDNCHDAATLFKLFLRELTEPVFPTHYYSTALRLAEEQNISAIHELLRKFDTINVEVIAFVINFLISFLKPDYLKTTMMNASNLATVFAPTLLRCPSDNPLLQITASVSETKFVLLFLENFLEDLKEDYFIKKH